MSRQSPNPAMDAGSIDAQPAVGLSLQRAPGQGCSACRSPQCALLASGSGRLQVATVGRWEPTGRAQPELPAGAAQMGHPMLLAARLERCAPLQAACAAPANLLWTSGVPCPECGAHIQELQARVRLPG